MRVAVMMVLFCRVTKYAESFLVGAVCAAVLGKGRCSDARVCVCEWITVAQGWLEEVFSRVRCSGVGGEGELWGWGDRHCQE